MTPEEKKLRDDLLSDLLQIRRLSGEYKISKEAQELYEAWYKKQEADREDGLFPVTGHRFSGYIARRQTHCHKLISAELGHEYYWKRQSGKCPAPLEASAAPDILVLCSTFESISSSEWKYDTASCFVSLARM